MKKPKTNARVDAYFRRTEAWRAELGQLRKILLGCGLTEELKWGKPCYTVQAANVVVVLPLKNYCALLFCKGALLRDAQRLLIKPGENTQAARQMRFTALREITEKEAVLTSYIRQAIEVEKAGLEVVYKKTSDYVIPQEFQNKLDESPTLKNAFEALTPGRQRAYILYFSAAKQSKTREARVEKCRPRMMQGKGLNDP